ncbi:MAG: type II and III secretion system protein family protein [Alphaproteobacteria bacterium]|nr:type II and III secretion system protein family protein [Alphaproteobacteria bacterium]
MTVVYTKSKLLKPLAMLAAALLLFAAPAAVFAAKGDKGELASISPGPRTQILYVPLGKAELVDVEGDVADVMVANSSIIDVSAVQSNRLYVVGLQVGDTNIIAIDDKGDIIKRLDVHVKYDLDAIQALVTELFPDEDIKVGSIHDQILLSGKVSTPAVASKATSVVGHYVSDLQNTKDPLDELIANFLEVRGEQQVMLQVRIVEASRTVLKELGLESHANDPNEISATTMFGDNPPNATTSHGNAGIFETGAGIALSQDPVGIARWIFDTGISSIGQIGLVLNALEEENLVNILAEPNLTAVSGEQAGFLAGGEFPVPVGRDQTGNVVVEFREFGVSLNFRPVVQSGDRISLQLNTEVSSLDFENALPADDLTIPGLDVRRAETTVEIPSGGSLMIAGLIKSEAVKGMSGLPGIRKTPVLGKLVSSDSFQRDETELVVFVTPYLVKPYADKTQVKEVPKEETAPLAAAFAANIRRNYNLTDDTIFEQDGAYGYLLQ